MPQQQATIEITIRPSDALAQRLDQLDDLIAQVRSRVEAVGGTVVELDPLADAKLAVQRLYRTRYGAVGGPLHIVTDDGNVEDSYMLWCAGNLADWQRERNQEASDDLDRSDAAETVGESLAVLAALWPLTEDERLVACGLDNQRLEEQPDVAT